MEKEIILVTGANGQLGRCIEKLSKQYEQYDFIFTDIEELDITSNKDVTNFFNENRIDIIINAAAYTAVDKAEEEFDKANLVNNVAVANLVRAATRNRIKLIQVSTDYVFNGCKTTPYLATDNPSPRTVYGRTKFRGEKEALNSSKGVIIVRTSWLYSEYGSNFVKTMLKLGKTKQEIDVVFDQIGTPTYAMDLAEFLLSLANKVVGKRIVHYSNEGVCSWYDFARKVMQYANLNCKVNPIRSFTYEHQTPRPHYSILDKTETKTIYNIEIPYWEDSLKKCIANLTKG
ncbi:MAG: dTDP-4-dehydrorhamnose reductase [Bacteroidales bacterium]|jgi:dTDP-4-dehydrorhamnose reductase|nr:dTDP-4-dehydrorhamnose reductase [Bacteroidales bacterium]